MRLSPKQLRLVFAKLREKGLLGYIRKIKPPKGVGVVYTKSGRGDTIFSPAELDSVLSGSTVQRYARRLPRKHFDLLKRLDTHVFNTEADLREFSRARSIPLGHDVEYLGYYSADHNILALDRNPFAYRSWVGYTSRPAFVAHSLPPRLAERGESVVRRRQLRNARVGAAKVFYHEAAHAVDAATPGGSKSREWHSIVSGSEWLMPAPSRFTIELEPPPSSFPFPRLKFDEAFAEAYSQYATGKVSRHRLSQERPDSYAFMKKFFEE